MRAFVLGVVVAVVLAVGGAVVLTNYVPDSSARAFSTEGVRI